MSDTDDEEDAEDTEVEAILSPAETAPRKLNVIWEDDKIQKVSSNTS